MFGRLAQRSRGGRALTASQTDRLVYIARPCVWRYYGSVVGGGQGRALRDPLPRPFSRSAPAPQSPDGRAVAAGTRPRPSAHNAGGEPSAYRPSLYGHIMFRQPPIDMDRRQAHRGAGAAADCHGQSVYETFLDPSACPAEVQTLALCTESASPPSYRFIISTHLIKRRVGFFLCGPSDAAAAAAAAAVRGVDAESHFVTREGRGRINGAVS